SSGKMIYNEMATGTSSYLLIDNLHLTNAIAYEPVIAFRDSDHLVISNILIDGGSNGTIRGIRFRTTSDSIIRDAQNIAVVSVTGTAAINSPDLLGVNSSNNTIRFNQLYGGRGTVAILLASYELNFSQIASFNEIYNNVVYDNAGQAFSFSDSSGLLSQHNKIYNNIFFHNTGISPNSPAGTTPQSNVYHFNNTVDWVTGAYGYNEVRNNIFLRNTGTAGEMTITKERNSSAGGYWDIENTIAQIQSDPNLGQYWWGNIELDPLFVNAAVADF